jgi:putative aldouronate transport system substrate-binding protein
MKKFFVLTLTLVCLTSLVFASGSRQSGGSVPTLVWYAMDPYNQDDLAENLRIMSDYTQEKIGIRFEMRKWDTIERMRMIINSAEPFDITWIGALQYEELVSLGALADITDTLPSQVPALWNYVPQLLWNGAKVNGKIYAVPAYKDTSSTLFGFFDERYVRKYNLDTNFKLKDYIGDMDKAFRAMKAGEGPSFYPLLATKGGTEIRYFIGEKYDDLGIGLSNFLGVRLDDQNRRVVAILEQPENIEVLRVVHRWYQDGIINPDAPQIEAVPRGAPFVFDQAWPSKAQTLATQHGIERYIPVQLTTPMINTHTIRGSMLAVGANSRYKNETLKLIELINTDHKFRDMLAYGIEGKHFNYVSPNVIHRITDTYFTYEWAQGTFFNMSTTDDQPPTTWDEVRKQNADAFASVLNGFSMDIAPVRNEIANVLAISQRYYPEISIGVTNPDTAIPQLMAALRDAGFDRIIAEAQRQIDAYYK